jgi:uncharacterized membrane protein
MNVLFIAYILACIIVITGTFYFNNNENKRIAAYVMPLLFLAIAVFFGMRWFNKSGDSIIPTNVSTTWPPPNSINVCPDFLSLRNDVTGSTKNYYCVDPLGVTTTAAGIQQWSSSASDSAKFKLGSTTAASTVNGVVTPASANWIPVATLCQNCFTMGLTWEGVCIPGSKAVQLSVNSKLPTPV